MDVLVVDVEGQYDGPYDGRRPASKVSVRAEVDA
jgi:hypothetical protein